MLVIVTDHNENEGEDFNFILDLTDSQIEKVEQYLSNLDVYYQEIYTLQKNTKLTPELVEELNNNSSNSYMDLYGYYKIPDHWWDDESMWDDENLFYKGGGLERL